MNNEQNELKRFNRNVEPNEKNHFGQFTIDECMKQIPNKMIGIFDDTDFGIQQISFENENDKKIQFKQYMEIKHDFSDNVYNENDAVFTYSDIIDFIGQCIIDFNDYYSGLENMTDDFKKYHKL